MTDNIFIFLTDTEVLMKENLHTYLQNLHDDIQENQIFFDDGNLKIQIKNEL